MTDRKEALQQRLGSPGAERRAARRIGPQDAGAIGAPQPDGGRTRGVRGKPGIAEIDGRTHHGGVQRRLGNAAGLHSVTDGSVDADTFVLTLPRYELEDFLC